MSNVFASTAQFFRYYDERVIKELSTDSGESEPPNIETIQLWLDTGASELEGYLEGRWAFSDPGTPSNPGTTPVPLVLTRWTCAKAIEVGYGRRVDVPKGVERDMKWAEDWAEKLIDGKVAIPDVGRTGQPTLDSSQFTDGSSITDNIFFLGFPPTPTSVKKGNQSEEFGQI